MYIVMEGIRVCGKSHLINKIFRIKTKRLKSQSVTPAHVGGRFENTTNTETH